MKSLFLENAKTIRYYVDLAENGLNSTILTNKLSRADIANAFNQIERWGYYVTYIYCSYEKLDEVSKITSYWSYLVVPVMNIFNNEVLIGVDDLIMSYEHLDRQLALIKIL